MKYNVFYNSFDLKIIEIEKRYNNSDDPISNYLRIIETNKAINFLYDTCSNHLEYVKHKNENLISQLCLLSEPSFLICEMAAQFTPGDYANKIRANTIKLTKEIIELKKEIELVKNENKELKGLLESCANDIVINGDCNEVNVEEKKPEPISVLKLLQK